jgi:hypothetical protein
MKAMHMRSDCRFVGISGENCEATSWEQSGVPAISDGYRTSDFCTVGDEITGITDVLRGVQSEEG